VYQDSKRHVLRKQARVKVLKGEQEQGNAHTTKWICRRRTFTSSDLSRTPHKNNRKESSHVPNRSSGNQGWAQRLESSGCKDYCYLHQIVLIKGPPRPRMGMCVLDTAAAQWARDGRKKRDVGAAAAGSAVVVDGG
jgi:hypothetical protein